MTSTKERIGRKIKKIRELRDFTQEYVAYEIGMTQSSYSDIERGNTDVSFTAIEKIAGVLEVSPTALIEFDENVVFNNAPYAHQTLAYGDSHITHNGITEKFEKLYEEKTKLLEDKIKLLEEKNAWLESQLRK
ncbi:MAG: helix-turn-helix transcriptional regulator [Bacteroidota bacterium]